MCTALVMLLAVQLPLSSASAATPAGTDYELSLNELNKLGKNSQPKKAKSSKRKKTQAAEETAAPAENADRVAAPPAAGPKAEAAVPAAMTPAAVTSEFIQIDHAPYSFVVPGRRTVIEAVINSAADVVSVSCSITAADGKVPLPVKMARAKGALFTYEATLPAVPDGASTLRYTIVVVDSVGREVRSPEFATPVTAAPVVPGWQLESAIEAPQPVAVSAAKQAEQTVQKTPEATMGQQSGQKVGTDAPPAAVGVVAAKPETVTPAMGPLRAEKKEEQSFIHSLISLFNIAMVPDSGKQAEAQRVKDWNGLWIDTGILVGAQLVTCGVLLAMPESVTQWTAEQKKNVWNHYGENFVNPIWDKDTFYINYVLHPYWGATYYIRARERGFDPWSSMVTSFAWSALYEFGTECFFEKPSIQDLIFTPTLGALVGAYVFEPWRDYMKGKPELAWYDHISLVLTDPIGVLSLWTEKMFGIQSTIIVNYVPQNQHRQTSGPSVASAGNRSGATFQFTF